MLIKADARYLPLRDKCVQTVVTSPPYWGLRDYGTAKWEGGSELCDHGGGEGPASAKQNTSPGTQTIGYRLMCGKCGAVRQDSQIGLEPTPDAYVASILSVMREVWRALKDDGTVWLNLGDSYSRAVEKGGSGPNGKHDYIPSYGDARRHMSESKGSSDGAVGRGDRAAVRVGSEGLKPKDLVGIPWRVAFALQADGWYLRSDIIWSKPNPMPESVTDRPTKAHEYIFLLTKQERYFYDAGAIREPHSEARDWPTWEQRKAGGAAIRRGDPGVSGDVCRWAGVGGHPDGRNKRSVWHVATQPYSGSHFATFPEALIEPCILAGSRPGDLVFDPFIGSGTTGVVCERNARRWVGTDLGYHHLSSKRTAQKGLRFFEEAAAV